MAMAEAKPEVKSPSRGRTYSRSDPVPPFVDDASKITLKFLFANHDGLGVIVDCKPTDTAGDAKALLLSMWPDGKRSAEQRTFCNWQDSRRQT